MLPSMRYSRQLEESSYAGRKADYVWLLFCCSGMLLVSCLNSSTHIIALYHEEAEPAAPLV